MNDQKINAFTIIGLAVRTANGKGQAETDIPALWNRFMSSQAADQIPGKTDDTLYCVYTDYEKDHTAPYTVILGCRVHSIDQLPEGMTSVSIKAGNYVEFTAKGNIMEGIVYHTWLDIWASGLDRAYETDFEVYGPKAQDPGNAEVPVFIGV
ncbi:GyrI-like domain-containing protein [Pedobacter sp. MR2016-24]|uniref:GyrI-like domain-containing protein n=1 Tax=Pedobacter sp. MR2016-24 TaxID=2994466 RepID=UPI00224854F5|nr:GyrI-like domain-containing protein [Pedobacter sp. MR2016-24]MCX2484573.1 GyrI-like domain-containing protein [Pedobacter sp. MR2016-24]